MPLPVAIDVAHVAESVIEIRAAVKVGLPHAMRASVSGLEDVVAGIALPDGIELTDGDGRRGVDVLPAGEMTTLRWTATVSPDVRGRIEIAVAGTVRGTEPYAFSEVVGSQASLTVRSVDRAEARADT